MTKKKLKYTIDDRLNALSKKVYADRLNELLNTLGVARSTLNEWRKLTKDSDRDIPAGKLKIIADFFGCKMEDLIITPPPAKADRLAKKFKIKKQSHEL